MLLPGMGMMGYKLVVTQFATCIRILQLIHVHVYVFTSISVLQYSLLKFGCTCVATLFLTEL